MAIFGPFSAEQAARLSRQLAAEAHAVAIAEDARGHWLRLVDEEAVRSLERLLNDERDHIWQQAPRVAASSGEAHTWRLPPSGWLTRSVLALCVLVYAGMQLWPRPVFEALHFFTAMSQFATDPWRWFTPALMHFSVLHIVFNLLWWWQLGGLIESRQGSARLLLIFGVGAALPHLLQWWWQGPDFGGLSGVVYALLGYVWLTGRLRPQAGIQVPGGVMIMMLLWLAWGFFAFIGPSMANGAHLGGLLVGLALAWLVPHRTP